MHILQQWPDSWPPMPAVLALPAPGNLFKLAFESQGLPLRAGDCPAVAAHLGRKLQTAVIGAS